MEKYGTPQVVDNSEEGIYKVSAEKLKRCCLTLLKKVDGSTRGSEIRCACGNTIVIEKDE